MSKHTRHAAELGARLHLHIVSAIGKEGQAGNLQYRLNPSQIAQDVDKLLRLSASLRGIGKQKCGGTRGKCLFCEGTGKGPKWQRPVECTACEGSGYDCRRERRLTQAVTDSLKPYGLTWIPAGPGTGAAIYIVFSNDGFNV